MSLLDFSPRIPLGTFSILLLCYFRMAVKIRLYQAITTTGSFSDRLSGMWTVVILIILSTITFWMQMRTVAISCYTPDGFLEIHTLFITEHCKYANVITKAQDFPYDHLGLYHSTLPLLTNDVVNEKSRRTIYQWIPLILVFQALFFKIPDILWTAGLSIFGFNISKLNAISDGYEHQPNVERRIIGKQMARYLFHYVKSSTVNGCPWGFITLLYLFIKSLIFSNAIIQFVMLNQYLHSDKNTMHYSDVLFNNINDHNALAWQDSQVFPTSVQCRFTIFQLGNALSRTAQCTIPLNNWYQHISALVWIWLLFIMAVTVMSCAVETIKLIIPVCRKR